MPHLSVPGAELYYEAEGQASAPAILLIHAGCATLRMWDSLVPALAVDHYVVRFDSRGYGQTRTDDVKFSDRADARDVLDHLGVQRATVVGASRGGRIALDLALESPERVAGVATVGSGPSGFPDTELTDDEDAAFDALDDAYEDGDWALMTRLETALWVIGPTRDESTLDPEFVQLAYALNRPNTTHRAEAPVSVPLDPPAYPRISDLRMPVLATVGEYDLSFELAAQAFLVDALPQSEGYVFSDTAHLPSVEHPHEFSAVLTRWLAKHRL
ncbi:alpha/beta fold hydrolase [Humibacter albus]|uniref:alpha/beta fold hydrolase n=1 Tax=Humibacter albus TaxID=427754 RepID=UPI0003B75083|nr:alpha/beta hydrolase [Humibacter albus]